MKKFIFVMAVMFLSGATNSFAVDNFLGMEEIDDFSPATPDNKTTDDKVLSTFLSSRLPAAAARNIEKAEKVFCYTVSYADSQDESYTLNGMSIKGSCGELSANGKKLFNDALWHNTTVFSGSMDNCKIEPKLMLQYIYGPDSTDVLISYPCPAIIFYHDRDVITVNAAPGEKLLEQITKTYSSLAEPYVSPALLGQMIPNGQILNQAQKEQVRRFGNSDSSRKKWNNETAEDTAEATNSSPAKTGWNRLK